MTAKESHRTGAVLAPPFGSAKDPVNFVGYVIRDTWLAV